MASAETGQTCPCCADLTHWDAIYCAECGAELTLRPGSAASEGSLSADPSTPIVLPFFPYLEEQSS